MARLTTKRLQELRLAGAGGAGDQAVRTIGFQIKGRSRRRRRRRPRPGCCGRTTSSGWPPIPDRRGRCRSGRRSGPRSAARSGSPSPPTCRIGAMVRAHSSAISGETVSSSSRLRLACRRPPRCSASDGSDSIQDQFGPDLLRQPGPVAVQADREHADLGAVPQHRSHAGDGAVLPGAVEQNDDLLIELGLPVLGQHRLAGPRPPWPVRGPGCSRVSSVLPIMVTGALATSSRPCGSQRSHSQARAALLSHSTTSRRSTGERAAASCSSVQRPSAWTSAVRPAMPSTRAPARSTATGTGDITGGRLSGLANWPSSLTGTGSSATPSRSASASGSVRRRSHNRLS